MTQLTATDRAHQINAETEARCAQRGITWFGLLTTEASYWADFGISTGEELDQYLSFCDYVESYKEAHNIKPRWFGWRDRSAAEWQKMSAEA